MYVFKDGIYFLGCWLDEFSLCKENLIIFKFERLFNPEDDEVRKNYCTIEAGRKTF